MSSWKIDPSTGDYVQSAGAPVTDNTLLTPAYLRLRTRRTQWLYAPNDQYGSDFYLLHRRTPQREVRRLPDAAQAALAPIVDDGRAQRTSSVVKQLQRHGAVIQTTIVDSQGSPQVLEVSPLGVR